MVIVSWCLVHDSSLQLCSQCPVRNKGSPKGKERACEVSFQTFRKECPEHSTHLISPLECLVGILQLSCPVELLIFPPYHPSAAAFPMSVHVSSCLPISQATNFRSPLICLFLSHSNGPLSLIIRPVIISYWLSPFPSLPPWSKMPCSLT